MRSNSIGSSGLQEITGMFNDLKTSKNGQIVGSPPVNSKQEDMLLLSKK